MASGKNKNPILHADAGVRARIDGLCREHKPKKCQVAVYKSGAGGL